MRKFKLKDDKGIQMDKKRLYKIISKTKLMI